MNEEIRKAGTESFAQKATKETKDFVSFVNFCENLLLLFVSAACLARNSFGVRRSAH